MKRLGFSDYLTLLALFIIFYLIMSTGSLIQIAAGEDISYMSFWHDPWRWLVKLFGIL